MSRITGQNNIYKAALYCRLSRDDDNNMESESIVNQKRMLAKFARDSGFLVGGYYIDDGYSGTTFNRPEFLRMLSDIEDRKINMVITKDLSRLGRDYIQTGYYLEVFFPQKDVRYIALNDNIDTLRNDNDIAPFKNILNEMYAKDISKKVRAAFKAKAENGEFIGSFAPYGYKKDPHDKNRLIVDEPAAEVVRRAFGMAADGCGINRIARSFNEEGILNPSMYKSLQRSSYLNNLRIKGTTYWTNSTVRKMLSNIVYTGVLAQGKQRTKSFKCRKRVKQSESDWIVVENTHQPVIDSETWASVQRMLSVRKRPMSDGDVHLFAGLVKCMDCGRFMSLGKKANGSRYFVCGTYKNYGPDYCERHGIRYDHLYGIVLNEIGLHAKKAELNRDALALRLASDEAASMTGAEVRLKSEISACGQRINEIDLVFNRLYEDRIKGNITEQRFLYLSRQYEDEQAMLKSSYEEKVKRLETVADSSKDADYWKGMVKKYTQISELDRGILNELVDRILVGGRKVNDGCIIQEVKMVFKFSG